MTSDDPFDDPRWQQAEAMAAARSKPNQRFIGCPLWCANSGQVSPQGHTERKIKLTKWGSAVNLRCEIPKPPMSALGQKMG
jgi:hypothetical protein